MLEPVRQYAAERLRQAGEQRRGRAATSGVGGLASARGRDRVHARAAPWSARLRDEQDNVRQAMESALAGVDPEAALRIAAALGHPWFTMGQPDALAWVARALDAAPGHPTGCGQGAVRGRGCWRRTRSTMIGRWCTCGRRSRSSGGSAAAAERRGR